MAGISVPVPSVDDGAIVAALHIVWVLRGRGRNPRERAASNPGYPPVLECRSGRGVGNAAPRSVRLAYHPPARDVLQTRVARVISPLPLRGGLARLSLSRRTRHQQARRDRWRCRIVGLPTPSSPNAYNNPLLLMALLHLQQDACSFTRYLYSHRYHSA